MIAAAIVSQTATPQCTKVTVLPDGMAWLNGGRPIEVGRASATLSSASAAATADDVELAVTPAFVLLTAFVLRIVAPLLQAAITMPSAAASAAPANRRWASRASSSNHSHLLVLICVCGARRVSAGLD